MLNPAPPKTYSEWQASSMYVCHRVTVTPVHVQILASRFFDVSSVVALVVLLVLLSVLGPTDRYLDNVRHGLVAVAGGEGIQSKDL